jgi:HEAT repeat protein
MRMDDDDYQFNAQDLDSDREELRTWAVIFISHNRLNDYVDKLISMIHAAPPERLRRHIIRALGNLGSRKAVPILLDILKQEEGLICGDVAQALGRLGVTESQPLLERLATSRTPWVAQNACWALKQLVKRFPVG